MSLEKKQDPFAALDGRKASVISGDAPITTVLSLKDADEELAFLEDAGLVLGTKTSIYAVAMREVMLKMLISLT